MPRKHLTHVEESVDALIDSLMEFQETFQLSFNSSQSDSIVGLLKHKNSSERIHDQIHNKTTLTDSDCMTYLFQNQDSEAKKAVESLGVTGHSYPTVVKTLKCQFWNPNSVATAYLNNMLDRAFVMIDKHYVTTVIKWRLVQRGVYKWATLLYSKPQSISVEQPCDYRCTSEWEGMSI